LPASCNNRSILVYSGEGVSPLSFRHVVTSLRAVCSIPVIGIDHSHFAVENWEESCALLVFPGGRDLPFQDKLRGSANKRISDYVSNGGKYLGLCAGAYYASAQVEFEKGGQLEVIGARELAFFPGKTVGPALGLGSFQYHSERGAQAARVRGLASPLKNEIYHLYYNGGCAFENAQHTSNTQILACYEDAPEKPAAIVLCKVGKGEALLTGLHPEYVPGLEEVPSSVLRALQKGDKSRLALWKSIISLLIL
jgi:biotin--protein ligase